MLEEELIDLYTFCLQNPDSPEVEQKKARITEVGKEIFDDGGVCLLYTSPSPRDATLSRMPSSA